MTVLPQEGSNHVWVQHRQGTITEMVGAWLSGSSVLAFLWPERSHAYPFLLKGKGAPERASDTSFLVEQPSKNCRADYTEFDLKVERHPNFPRENCPLESLK